MNKTSRLQMRRYINSLSLATLMVLIIGNILFFTAGCGRQTTIRHRTLVKAPIQPNGYETPEVLSAQEILPPELLEGEYYDVHKGVVTYGFTNYFTITSPFGTFEAEGEDMLRIRIHEIKAIAALEEIKKTKAFSEAAKKATTSPVKGAWHLITNPVNTVTGVPKGVGRLFGRVGEMVKGKRGDTEDSIAKELIGFSKVKRQYAHKMDVDVYSSNKVLQKELNSVSWAGFAGGVGVSLAMMPIRAASTAAYISIQATKFTYGMNQILLDNAPEDLRRLNRKILKEMEVEDSVIEEFLLHSKFSPRHKTFIVHALAEMENVKNRDQFIKQALFAESELDAFIFQWVAEMMYGYHENMGPIKEIIPVRRLVVGYTADQKIVATIPIDYLNWTERAVLGLKAITRLKSADRPVKQIELWATGRLTPRAKTELSAKGVVFKEQIRERLMPPSTSDKTIQLT